ncbi:hypothetical protein C7Y66_16055 [Chroococcidiopsis sp. CCALA 051]|nr:hypothetical protein C7Y66_16055 [Chroococcidiopsis sp. CCALA 051]
MRSNYSVTGLGSVPETIPEIITFEEMQHRYAGKWVLIAEHESDENMRVVRGEVLVHSVNRDEVYDRLKDFQGRSLAIEYIGTPPPEWAVML